MTTRPWFKRLMLGVSALLVLVVLSVASYPLIPTPGVQGYKLKRNVREISSNAPVKVIFTQPMDHRSVEENFSITPNVEGSFSWRGNTMFFAPAQDFPKDGVYDVKISKGAKSFFQKGMETDYEEVFKITEPPQVALATPSDNTVVPVDAKITVQFDRPMIPLTSLDQGEQHAIEVNFEPPIKGRYKWMGTSAFQFIPEKLDYATSYKVKIPKGTNSADGGELEDDYEFAFETPKPQLQSVSPRNKDRLSGPDAKVFLTFNQKINLNHFSQHTKLMAGGTDKAQEWDDALLNVNGTGSYFEARYRTNNAEELKNKGWKSIPFQAYYYNEAEYKKRNDTDEELTEDQKKRLERTIVIKPNQPLAFDTHFAVMMDDQIKGVEGDHVTGYELRTGFKTVGGVKVSEWYPKKADTRPHRLSVTFTNPMDEESVNKYLTISPAFKDEDGKDFMPKMHMNYNNTRVTLYPAFKPSTKYEVKVKKGVKDKFGQAMKEDFVFDFETAAKRPSFYLEQSSDVSVMNGQKDAVFYVRSTNINTIDFKVKRLGLDEFEKFYRNGYADFYQKSVEGPFTSWTENVKGTLNERGTLKIDLEKKTGNRVGPGIYYVEAYSPDIAENYGRTKRTFFFVSDSALAYKSSKDKSLVWATSLTTGEPVSGMEIVALGNDGGSWAEVATGTTNSKGIAEMKISKTSSMSDWNHPDVLVYGTKGRDFAVVHSSWSDGISPWNFNIDSSYDPNPYYGYIYSDRPIYRPGHTVHFKGIMRTENDVRFRIPSEKTVEVNVNDSQGNEVFKKTLTLNKNGTFNDSLTLDGNAIGGDYSINARIGDDEDGSSFYGSFRVAEYRKPTYKVDITPEKKDYADKETAKIKVNGAYYFGAPLSDSKVKWTVKSMDYYFNEYTKDWYSFSEDGYFCYWGCEGESEVVSEGKGVLDSEGNIMIELPLDISKKKMSQIYTIEVTAYDVTNQAVSNRVAFPVHQGQYYVGVKNTDYVVSAGDAAKFDVISVDYEGEPVGGKSVEAVFSKRTWNTVRKKNVDGGYYYESESKDDEVARKRVTTGSDGKAQVSFNPKDGGLYSVRLESVDGLGNKITATTSSYVSSSDFVYWGRDNHDRIELVPDKQEYSVGDTAQVLVKSPYKNVKALVSYERAGIMDYKVMDFNSNSEVLEIPITERHVPNLFVSVVLMKGSDVTAGIEKPKQVSTEKADEREIEAFKVGYTTLFVDTATKALNIDVQTNFEKYGPGDEVTISVKTTDAAGKPVPAEVSLSVVDESVLALTQSVSADLINYFYRQRMLGVSTSHSLTKALARVNVLVEAGLKGGGGGDRKKRSKFKDTAYWNAEVQTDASGKGDVKFKLPDNLTTWQVLAIGVTKDTLVGSTKESFLSTKDVLIQPATPRFMIVNDELELGVVVHNKTDKDMTTEVLLGADGLEVEGKVTNEAHRRSITVKAQGKEKVMWPVKVLNEDKAVLNFEVRGDALEISLPIKPFSFPEVVATSGTLTGNKTRVETVWLPNDIQREFGDLTVTAAPTLANSIAQGIEYLVRFPYGCAEQTASSLLPNLVVSEVMSLPAISKDTIDMKKLKENVETGLQRLYTLQNGNGGWGLWESSQPTPYLTSYVVYTLHTAQRAGYSVDQNVLKNGINYLRKHMQNHSLDADSRYQANSRAYALYVLGEMGEGDSGLMNNLYDRRKDLSVYGKALLAMAMDKNGGASGKVEQLKKEVLNTQKVSPRGVAFEEDYLDHRMFDTNTRTTAMVLQMLSRVDSDNAILDKIMRDLLMRKKGHSWATTQDTSMTLLALVEYLKSSNELEPAFNALITLNNETKVDQSFTKANIDHKETVSTPLTQLLGDNNDNEVKFTQEGTGKLYYDMVMKYYLPTEEVMPREQGITVHHEYYALDDEKEENPLEDIKLGDVVKGRLTVIAGEDLRYVAVEDFLPAGLEGIDFNLETSEQGLRDDSNKYDSWYWWNPLWYFNHQEVRDDRMVYFADYLPKGVYEITYYARATSAGTFRDLPAKAEEMYFPEIFGRSRGRLLKVVE